MIGLILDQSILDLYSGFVQRGYKMRFLILLLFHALLSSTASLSQYTVKLSLSTHTCGEGQNLTAVCEVTGNSGYIVIWLKKSPTVDNNEEQDQREVEIATNSYVNYDFQQTGRFRADHLSSQVFLKVNFTLHISDTKSGDSGYIGCRIPNNGTFIEEFQQFTVEVPIQSVLWSSTSTSTHDSVVYADGQIASFVDDDIVELTCNVNGSYPKPRNVRVILGAEDITANFSVSSVLVQGKGEKGLQPLYYRMFAINRSFQIQYRFHKQMLTCIARDSSESQFVMMGSVTIVLKKYKPQFLCDGRIAVQPDGQTVKLSCLVRAIPAINDTKFLWNNTAEDAMDYAQDDDEEGEGREESMGNEDEYINRTVQYRLRVDELNSSDTRMVLTINKVSAQHLGTYTFTAENDVGRVRHVIELHQESSFDLHSRSTAVGERMTSLLSLLVVVSLQLLAFSMTSQLSRLSVCKSLL